MAHSRTNEIHLPIIHIAVGHGVEGIVREGVLIVAIPRNFKGFLDIVGFVMVGHRSRDSASGWHGESSASKLQEKD